MLDGQGTVALVALPIDLTAKLVKRPPSLGDPWSQSILSKAALRPIVVVDDTKLNLKIMGSMLGQLGYTNVQCLEDGFSFLSWLITWAKDLGDAAVDRKCLCLMDRNMPSMSGAQVIKTARKLQKDLDVECVFVGVTAGNWAPAADGIPPMPTLQKPVKRDQLRNLVESFYCDDYLEL